MPSEPIDVQRWDFDPSDPGELSVQEGGDFVFYVDYAAANAKLAEQAQEIERALTSCSMLTQQRNRAVIERDEARAKLEQAQENIAKQIAEWIRQASIPMPIIPGQTKQDAIAAFALALADEIETPGRGCPKERPWLASTEPAKEQS